jgi:hypothetical protein
MSCKFYDFDWKDILEASLEKAIFNHDDLIVRLKSFPQILLDSINIIDLDFLKNFEHEFPLIVEEINKKKKHTFSTSEKPKTISI